MAPADGGTTNGGWTSVYPGGTVAEPVFGVDRVPTGAVPASLSALGREGVATTCDGELSFYVARNGPYRTGPVGLSVEWDVPVAVEGATRTLCMSL